MNAEDCMVGATPEERRLTAECLAALQPILAGRSAKLSMKAAARAACVVAYTAGRDGRERPVMDWLVLFTAGVVQIAAERDTAPLPDPALPSFGMTMQ